MSTGPRIQLSADFTEYLTTVVAAEISMRVFRTVLHRWIETVQELPDPTPDIERDRQPCMTTCDRDALLSLVFAT